jgi:hypothetical protein
MILLAIETKDSSLIRPANDYLEQGRLENEKWRSELIALGGEHGVKMEEKEGGGSRILNPLVGNREASDQKNEEKKSC